MIYLCEWEQFWLFEVKVDVGIGFFWELIVALEHEGELLDEFLGGEGLHDN